MTALLDAINAEIRDREEQARRLEDQLRHVGGQLDKLAQLHHLAQGLEAGEAPDRGGELTPPSPPRAGAAASNGGGPGASPAPKPARPRSKPRPAPQRAGAAAPKAAPGGLTLADRVLAVCASQDDATIHTIQQELAGHGTPGSIRATLGKLVTAGRITKHGTRGRQTYRPAAAQTAHGPDAPEPAPADPDFVRRERRELVLHTLREQGPMTAGRLRQQTELGHGAIVQILAELDRQRLAHKDPRTSQWAAYSTTEASA